MDLIRFARRIIPTAETVYMFHVLSFMTYDVADFERYLITPADFNFVSSRMKLSLMLRWTLNGIKCKKTLCWVQVFHWLMSSKKQQTSAFSISAPASRPRVDPFSRPLKFLPSVLRARSSLFPSTFVVQGTLTQ